MGGPTQVLVGSVVGALVSRALAQPGSTTVTQPVIILPVRGDFDPLVAYQANDVVLVASEGYVAQHDIDPGPFLSTDWAPITIELDEGVI